MDSIGANIGKIVLMALVFVGAIALVAVYSGEYGYQLGFFAANGNAGPPGENSGQRPIPIDVLLGCLVMHEPYDQCAQDIPPAPASSPPPPPA